MSIDTSDETGWKPPASNVDPRDPRAFITHPAITTPEMFIAAMAGQVSSPTLKATSGGAFLDNDLFDPEWEQFEMRERVRKDHDQAANRATCEHAVRTRKSHFRHSFYF